MSGLTKVSKVYRLEPNVDDPRYEGFGFDREQSLRGKSRLAFDFMPDDIPIKGRAWTVTRMAHLWTPQPVSGRVRPYNDYPCVNLGIPAFSRRAVEALRDLLETNGELLPLVSGVGEYFAYNVTTVADVLDEELSDIDWYDNPAIKLPSSIIRFVFRPEKLDGLSIFRLVEDPARTYVTNLFVDRVRAHGLQGFAFRRLWRHGLQEDREREDQEKDGRGAEGLTSESVIVRLVTAKSKPSKAEMQRADELMDQIDSWLLSSESEGPYLGTLEGHEYARRECRLHLSCPSAESLASYLAPRLRAIAWEGAVLLRRRYGDLDDRECREEEVGLERGA